MDININRDELLKLMSTCNSRKELIIRLGLHYSGTTNKFIKEKILSLGIVESDYYNYKPITRFSVTKEILEKYVLESNTYKEVLEKLGFENPVGSSYRCLKDKIKEYDISTKHMNHTYNGDYKVYTDNEVFCKDSKVTQASLRKRVLKLKAIPYTCVHCGNTGEWNGKPLTLTLDHKNGNRTDNRIENLQFVCPNCDKQQETFGSKNKKRYYK